jgi:hypothetical protein
MRFTASIDIGHIKKTRAVFLSVTLAYGARSFIVSVALRNGECQRQSIDKALDMMESGEAVGWSKHANSVRDPKKLLRLLPVLGAALALNEVSEGFSFDENDPGAELYKLARQAWPDQLEALNALVECGRMDPDDASIDQRETPLFQACHHHVLDRAAVPPSIVEEFDEHGLLTEVPSTSSTSVTPETVGLGRVREARDRVLGIELPKRADTAKAAAEYVKKEEELQIERELKDDPEFGGWS